VIEPYYHDEKYGITIYLGGCLEIIPQLEPVDLVLTDPPYGVNKAEWDNVFPPFQIWELLKNKMVNGGNIVVFPGEINAPFKINILASVFDYQWIWVWYKPNAMQFGKTGFSKQSLAWWFSKGEPSIKPKILDIIIFPIIPGRNKFGHPSPKPLEVILPLAKSLTNEQSIVLDPFMGSGTTLVAAKELGRKAIGIEIEEKYVEIAVKRLQQDVFQWEAKHEDKEN